MDPQVLEGTLTEIQQLLRDLPYPPETRVRVTVEEANAEATQSRTGNRKVLLPVKETTTDAAATLSAPGAPFQATEFRNGVPLLPRRDTAEPITIEFVQRLFDEEDEERLRAGRTAGR